MWGWGGGWTEGPVSLLKESFKTVSSPASGRSRSREHGIEISVFD